MADRKKINANTKISELISADKGCIDAIAAVARPLRRLKNPLLRKVMAPRVTIAEAARIADTTVEAIVTALAPLGFEYVAANETSPDDTASENRGAHSTEAIMGAIGTAGTGGVPANAVVSPKKNETQNDVDPDKAPGWLATAKPEDISYIDVRPMIESGSDPLKQIMTAFGTIAPGGVLCVINSFAPTPLIRLFEQKLAESSHLTQKDTDLFHTYFRKKQKEENQRHKQANDILMEDADSFSSFLHSFDKEQIVEIDVRHLEMPAPMETILAELANLRDGQILYVHHKRVPLYLLEELEGSEYEVHIYTAAEGEVKIIFSKKKKNG